MTDRIASRYYHGTTAVLHPGDRLEPIAGRPVFTTDPAQALADAWRVAAEEPGVPHVYELRLDEDKSLVVTCDILITGALAWRAEEIMRAK